MAKQTETSGNDTPDTQTMSLGRKSDPSIREKNPSISDDAALKSVLSNVQSLAERLQMLDSQNGPFGSDDFDFASGRVTGLIEDLPALPSDVSQDASGEKNVEDPVSSEDLSENPIEDIEDVDWDDQGFASIEEDDLDIDDILGEDTAESGLDVLLDFDEDEDIFDDEPDLMQSADLPEDFDISDIFDERVPADEGTEEASDLQDILGSDASLDAIFSGMEDDDEPADEGVEPGTEIPEKRDVDAVKTSPFAALFDVSDAEIEDDDEFLSENVDIETALDEPDYIERDPDFDDLYDDFHDEVSHDAGNQGYSSFSGFPTLGSEALLTEHDIADSDTSEDAASASSDLPEPSMWEDDGILAPGTSYDEEEQVELEAPEEPGDSQDTAFSATDDDDAFSGEQGQDYFEKDEPMTVSEHDSEHNEKPEDNIFDASEIDDILNDAGDHDASFDDWSETAEDDANTWASEEADDTPAADQDDWSNEAAQEEDIFAAESNDTDASDATDADAVYGENLLTDEADTPEEAASEAPKASKKKTVLLSAVAASVLLAAGLGGAAYMGVFSGPAVHSKPKPAVTAMPVIQRDMTPITEVSDVSMDDMARTEDAPGDDLAVIDLEALEPIESDSDAGIETVDIAIDPIAAAGAGKVRLADLMKATDAKTDVEAETPAETATVAIDPVVIVEEKTISDEEMAFDITGQIDSSGNAEETAEPADSMEGVDLNLSLAALAAEIEAAEERRAPTLAEEIEEAQQSNAIFVEVSRFETLEDRVDGLSSEISDLAGEISQLNSLLVRNMEQNATMGTRVAANERSLRTMTAIVAEFSAVRESLDQTQVVLLDMAARVSGLEQANPADQETVDKALSNMQGEIRRLTANMAILARMTVNGVSALETENGATAQPSVRTSVAEQASGGRDTVFAEQEAQEVTADPFLQEIPASVKKGDFFEGYGYVLDIIPAHGNKKLVIMENGSTLIPN